MQDKSYTTKSDNGQPVVAVKTHKFEPGLQRAIEQN